MSLGTAGTPGVWKIPLLCGRFFQLLFEKVLRNPKNILLDVITARALNAKAVGTVKTKAACKTCVSSIQYETAHLLRAGYLSLSQALSHTAPALIS